MAALTEACAAQNALRALVIRLDPADGLLRAMANGWARSPQVPNTVVVFDDEEQFLTADTRRAAHHALGGATIDGVEAFGHGWRRDGDDLDNVDFHHGSGSGSSGSHDASDVVLPGERADDGAGMEVGVSAAEGPWSLGVLPRTSEVYAVRRSGWMSNQVWLLATGMSTKDAITVLAPLRPRMIEPNSLLLAAQAIRAATRGEEHDSEGHSTPAGTRDARRCQRRPSRCAGENTK